MFIQKCTIAAAALLLCLGGAVPQPADADGCGRPQPSGEVPAEIPVVIRPSDPESPVDNPMVPRSTTPEFPSGVLGFSGNIPSQENTKFDGCVQSRPFFRGNHCNEINRPLNPPITYVNASGQKVTQKAFIDQIKPPTETHK